MRRNSRGLNPATYIFNSSTPWSDTKIDPGRLVMAYIIVEDPKFQIKTSLPIIRIEEIADEVSFISSLGINAVKVFIKPAKRSSNIEDAIHIDSFASRVLKTFRSCSSSLIIHTETCLCPFTTDTECILHNKGVVDESTYDLVAEYAVNQCEAGANVLGVSCMLNGMAAKVKHEIRSAGFQSVAVMPHVIIKSSFYWPFRRETGLVGSKKFRENYIKFHPTDRLGIINQAESFVAEGADMLLIEPACSTIDHLVSSTQRVQVPVSVFSVSGEFELFFGQNSSDESIRHGIEMYNLCLRCGADQIVTYAARRICTLQS
ncbi:MAG: hypothetical protein AAGA77_01910 [Bacteroidota bacterium]